MTQQATPLPPAHPASRLFFVAYGTPAPQGSKRHVGRGVMIEQNREALHTWRDDVKLAALAALEDAPTWARDARAVSLHVVFTLQRPRAHYRTGRLANLLRDDAPAWHGLRPDLDKLLRSTGDALTTAGVYADDARVAQVHARKVYSSTHANPTNGALPMPGARISLGLVQR